MKILDRWRVMRMRRELAALLAQDTQERNAAQTTDDMMNRMCARAEQIAMLRFNIRALEGDVDIDPDYPDDTRIPSSMFIPTGRDKE